MKKMKEWYDMLPPKRRLLVLFLLNLIYWFAIGAAMHWVWPSDYRDTFGELLFYATWMATIWTFLFNWETVKTAFKKNEQHNQ